MPSLEEKLGRLKELAVKWQNMEENTKLELNVTDVWSGSQQLNSIEMETDSVDRPAKKTTEFSDNAEEIIAPEYLLVGNLQEALEDKSNTLEENTKELVRHREDLSMCRRHLLSTQFQIEALENECSRLLSLEDQIVSVVTLLQKARRKCLSRQTLGQFILDIIDARTNEDNEDIQADTFLEALQQKLVEYPLRSHPGRSAAVQEWRSNLTQVSEEGPTLTNELVFEEKD